MRREEEMRSFYVCGKLPTYPSPKSTLTLLTLGKMLAKGRGRWGVSQKLIMIQEMDDRGMG